MVILSLSKDVIIEGCFFMFRQAQHDTFKTNSTFWTILRNLVLLMQTDFSQSHEIN